MFYSPNVLLFQVPQCRESEAPSCDEDGFNSMERQPYTGGMRRFQQPEPPVENNFQNHVPNNRNHNFPTLTKAELEVRTKDVFIYIYLF